MFNLSRSHIDTTPVDKLADQLTQHAISLGSVDNVTAVIVDFKHTCRSAYSIRKRPFYKLW